jgi:hypothetical protein
MRSFGSRNLPLAGLMLLACSGANTALPSTGATSRGSASTSSATDAEVEIDDASGVDMANVAPNDATLDDAASADVRDVVVDTAPPDPCAGLVFCDDFESTAAGGPPNPVLWSVGAPDCTGLGTLEIDDSNAHAGKHSVKITNDFESGAPAYCDHIFFRNSSAFSPASGLKSLYVRFFFKLADMVGNGHSTFVTMTDRNHGNTHVRLGFINQVFTWNLEPFSGADGSFPDTYLPDNDPQGAALSAAPPIVPAWQCVELHIDETTGSIDTWIDDAEVPGLMEPSTQPNVGSAWPPGWTPDIADLGFGWETYVGVPMTIWFDDVAVATHRIGCNPAEAGSD